MEKRKEGKNRREKEKRGEEQERRPASLPVSVYVTDGRLHLPSSASGSPRQHHGRALLQRAARPALGRLWVARLMLTAGQAGCHQSLHHGLAIALSSSFLQPTRSRLVLGPRALTPHSGKHSSSWRLSRPRRSHTCAERRGTLSGPSQCRSGAVLRSGGRGRLILRPERRVAPPDIGSSMKPSTRLHRLGRLSHWTQKVTLLRRRLCRCSSADK